MFWRFLSSQNTLNFQLPNVPHVLKLLARAFKILKPRTHDPDPLILPDL